jgi:hypothetical protein
MSLSEKLEQARRQRMLDADTSRSVPDGGEAHAQRTQIEIEMLPVGLYPVFDTHSSSDTVSAARRCPACQFEGRVDLVDLVGRHTHLTCERCGTMWQISTADPAELLD